MGSPSRQLDLLWEAEEDIPPDLCFEEFFDSLMDALSLDDVELSVLVIDDDRMTELNHQYRGKQRTTDVLSFPSGSPRVPGRSHHLGDIVISAPQARRQAEELGQGHQVELRFLLLHGVLHLLGHDHETDNGEMLALQSQLKQELEQFF